jgi:hypothetical protein
MMEPRTSEGERPSNPGAIYRFLAADHRRLDALLQRAAASVSFDCEAYAAFRAGLLRHIGLEEKVLLPAAQRLRGGEPLPIATKLRTDHGAIAALLVPTPTRVIIAALRSILAAHNEIEEGAGGLYETCDMLAAGETEALVERLRAYPEVPMNAHADGPRIMAATQRALRRAGFDDEAASLAADA